MAQVGEGTVLVQLGEQTKEAYVIRTGTCQALDKCLPTPIHMSIHVCIYVYIHVSMPMWIHMSICIDIHISIPMCMHMCIHMSLNMSIHISMHMSIHISMHMSTHMSIHISMPISIHVSIRIGPRCGGAASPNVQGRRHLWRVSRAHFCFGDTSERAPISKVPRNKHVS